MAKLENKIKVFGESMSATDTLTDEAYASDITRLAGNIVGIAKRNPNNKALKQATLLASALADFIAGGIDDNGASGSSVNDAMQVTEIATALRTLLNALADDRISKSDDVVHINGAETITGLKTFNTLPKSSATPTNDNELIQKSYADNINTTLSNKITTAQNTANANKNSIGTLSSLATTNKTNLVSAINELHTDIGNIDVDIPNASTTVKGIVQLSSAVNSTSEALAATPKAVKTAYDKANTANTTATTAKNTADSALTKANTADKEIGNLASLATSAKTNLVGAINEVHNELPSITAKVAQKGTRLESGTWTLTGLVVGKPLFFCCRVTTRHDIAARLRVTSGANVLWDSNDAPQGYSLAKGGNGSLVTIPTATTVVLEVTAPGASITIYAYQ